MAGLRTLTPVIVVRPHGPEFIVDERLFRLGRLNYLGKDVELAVTPAAQL